MLAIGAVALIGFSSGSSRGLKSRAVLCAQGGGIRALGFDGDGDVLLACGFDGSIIRWDMGSGRAKTVLASCNSAGFHSALSADGKMLAVGSPRWGHRVGSTHRVVANRVVLGGEISDVSVTLWSELAMTQRLQLPAEALRVQALRFSADGRTLVSADDVHVRLWDTATGVERAESRYESRDVICLAFSPDGKMLAAGCKDGMIRFRNLADDEDGLLIRAHDSLLSSLTFREDGRVLASTSSTDRIARLWEVGSGRLLTEMVGHTRPPLVAAFAPDGRILATAGFDETVRVWDVSTGNSLHTFSGHDCPITALAFSADGRKLASAASETVSLWDVDGIANP
jgi:WD40 repeat protein